MTTVTRPHSASTRDLAGLAQRHRLALRVAAPIREEQAQAHDAGAEEQARQHAGEEERRHRDRAAGGERIENGVVRRRDQHRLHRAADRDVGGEDLRVALLDHLRDQHRADRRGVGDRRAGDAAEERRGDDVDERQAAAHRADEDPRQVDEANRHAALGHDRAGEDEERDREQREAVDAARDLDHHRLERHVDPERAEDRGEAERVGDRHADHAQHHERAEQDGDVDHGGVIRRAAGRGT